MMVIENKYDIGEIVYLKTDPEQLPRFVFGFSVFRREVLYKLACGINVSEHYEFELSTEVDINIKAS